MNATRFYVLAHRGGSNSEFAENSLGAFREAVKLGCNYLETDVRLAGDGKLYLAHSATSWLPNRRLRVDQKLTTLEELFDSFPDSYFAIDPKHSLAIEPLAKLIVKKDMASRVCIGSSFDSRAIRVVELVKANSGIRPATALVSASASLVALLTKSGLSAQVRNTEASFIQLHRKVISPAVIHRAHRAGLKVIAWVVNDKQTMQKLREWRIDGFMTDYPQLAKEIGLLDLPIKS